MEEDTSKIRDTIGTVFIQGPSIVLLVWRSIMFNGSILRVCRILRFMKKIRFCLLELVHILSFIPRLWFSYSSFRQVQQPLIPSPMEEDTSKIRDTIGTVFIQGPSIVLPVWRCIMFNGSFLRVCRILRFMKKIRFCLLESGRTKPWCPGLVSRPSAKA